MRSRKLHIEWSTTAILTTLVALSAPLPAGPLDVRPPKPVGRYEIATRDDLLFAHLLAPLVKGDVAEWPVLGGLGKQLGDWVDRFVGAQQIANVITESFPIEGQPALRPLEAEVEHCARVLGLTRPTVYVRNSPFAQVYAARAFDRDHLVLTSGLLKLYEGEPGELRFIIGRELGHAKCGHLELKDKAFGLLTTVQAINLAVVPDKYQGVLPTLGLGRLYTWYRESEISADRAGLLCCDGPKVAYQAIMRLQHGLDKDSPWIDPEAGDFDPQAVIKTFQQWQYQSFVKLLVDLKRHTMTNPFVPERLAALKAWVDSGAYQAILDRPASASGDQLIEVVEIRAFELAPEGQTIDPYVIVFDGDHQILRTATVAGMREARWANFKSTDTGVAQPRPLGDGQPLFFEVWDSDYGPDTFVGGFVIYPNSHEAGANKAGERVAKYSARILWDWKEPQVVSRAGHGWVTIRFLERQPITSGKSSGKAGQ